MSFAQRQQNPAQMKQQQQMAMMQRRGTMPFQGRMMPPNFRPQNQASMRPRGGSIAPRTGSGFAPRGYRMPVPFRNANPNVNPIMNPSAQPNFHQSVTNQNANERSVPGPTMTPRVIEPAPAALGGPPVSLSMGSASVVSSSAEMERMDPEPLTSVTPTVPVLTNQLMAPELSTSATPSRVPGNEAAGEYLPDEVVSSGPSESPTVPEISLGVGTMTISELEGDEQGIEDDAKPQGSLALGDQLLRNYSQDFEDTLNLGLSVSEDEIERQPTPDHTYACEKDDNQMDSRKGGKGKGKKGKGSKKGKSSLKGKKVQSSPDEAITSPLSRELLDEICKSMSSDELFQTSSDGPSTDVGTATLPQNTVNVVGESASNVLNPTGLSPTSLKLSGGRPGTAGSTSTNSTAVSDQPVVTSTSDGGKMTQKAKMNADKDSTIDCFSCGETLESVLLVRNHMRQPPPCGVCGAQLKSFHTFKRHLSNHIVKKI